MTESVTQEEFERVVLFSLMADASNILFREWLPLFDERRDGFLQWRDRFIWAYIPAASRIMPLAMMRQRFGDARAEGGLVLELPADLVRALASTFLRDLLEFAKDYDAESRRDLTGIDVEAMVSDVKDRVGALWSWIGV